jgi:transcription-repair coupling factor (superfamily II helicase)
VLEFVQRNPRRTNLKEVKNTLRLSVDRIANIDEALEILSEMTVVGV